jgi:hypothetical protein
VVLHVYQELPIPGLEQEFRMLKVQHITGTQFPDLGPVFQNKYQSWFQFLKSDLVWIWFQGTHIKTSG